jgi:hypothetical protein
VGVESKGSQKDDSLAVDLAQGLLEQIEISPESIHLDHKVQMCNAKKRIPTSH